MKRGQAHSSPGCQASVHCKQPAALDSYLLWFIGHTFTGKACRSLLAPGLAEGESCGELSQHLCCRGGSLNCYIWWAYSVKSSNTCSGILVHLFLCFILTDFTFCQCALLCLFILGNIICIVKTPGFVNSFADRISFHGPGNGIL